MDPGHQERQEPSDFHDVTSWVSVCARGPWNVQRKRTQHRGRQATSSAGNNESCSYNDYPRIGSICRVRVRLKADLEDGKSLIGGEELSTNVDQLTADTLPSSFPRSQNSVLHLPLGDWTVFRLGDGQCDITEACVEGMRAGEICEVTLTPVGNGPNASAPQSADDNKPLHITIELHSFTPGKESWEMPPVEKWQWVVLHKERGGVRFRSGDVWGAADSYSRALKLLITLNSHTSPGDSNERIEEEDEEEEDEEQADKNSCAELQKSPKDSRVPTMKEYKTIKAELHSNISLCQLKLNQPERARASAAKATQLEPRGAKAWYRLGQACQMLNDLGEAKRAFGRLLELQPDSPAAQKALKYVVSKEKETNTQLGERLSKMFS